MPPEVVLVLQFDIMKTKFLVFAYPNDDVLYFLHASLALEDRIEGQTQNKY